MTGSILKALNEDGVSETIGAVLLVGLTVIGLALVGVIVFSQPLAERLPAVDIIVWNDTSTIFFQHNGGDSLGKDEFTIYVNGNAVVPDDLQINGEWPWSVGETLRHIPSEIITPLSKNVRMVYGSSDSGSVIRAAFVDKVSTIDDRGVIMPGDTYSLRAGIVVAESVRENSHVLVASGKPLNGGTVGGKYLNFTVDSDDSWMSISADSGVDSLAIDTKISICTREGANVSITGVGTTFFGLQFEKVDLRINDDSYNNVEIKSAWIPEYRDLKSDLAFTLGKNINADINADKLLVNGAVYFDWTAGTSITLENVNTTESGMFVINVWGNQTVSNAVIIADAEISMT
jgi:hypothetical protein